MRLRSRRAAKRPAPNSRQVLAQVTSEGVYFLGLKQRPFWPHLGKFQKEIQTVLTFGRPRHPQGSDVAGVGAALKSKTALSKPRCSSLRREGMADGCSGMALRGEPGCPSHGAAAGHRDLLPSRWPSPWPQGYCHTQGYSPRPHC